MGSCSAGSPEAIPTQVSQSQTGRRSPAVVCVQSPGSARRLPGLSALETKQKEKGNKHGYRLAPHRRQNPRCTPFFGGKGGGRGRGGAGESSYLRLNCRWRLRLFQDRKSSPKFKQTDKKKKNSKGAFNLERSALPTKDCKSWARSCWPGAGTATKPRAWPSGRRSAGAHAVAARSRSRLSSE